MKESRPIRLSKEMGLTHAEFFRTLPAAVAGRPYTHRHDEVVIGENDRCIVIKLGKESERIIGLLRLPKTRVDFTFSGYSQQEVDRFMTQFNLRFQRGGG